MNKDKRKSLEAKGWKVGSTEEFLSTYDREMSDTEFRDAFNRPPRLPRKLKKKYKKMGIWYAYLYVKGLYLRDCLTH